MYQDAGYVCVSVCKILYTEHSCLQNITESRCTCTYMYFIDLILLFHRKLKRSFKLQSKKSYGVITLVYCCTIRNLMEKKFTGSISAVSMSDWRTLQKWKA